MASNVQIYAKQETEMGTGEMVRRLGVCLQIDEGAIMRRNFKDFNNLIGRVDKMSLMNGEYTARAVAISDANMPTLSISFPIPCWTIDSHRDFNARMAAIW